LRSSSAAFEENLSGAGLLLLLLHSAVSPSDNVPPKPEDATPTWSADSADTDCSRDDRVISAVAQLESITDDVNISPSDKNLRNARDCLAFAGSVILDARLVRMSNSSLVT
jgi:hypothetical protein